MNLLTTSDQTPLRKERRDMKIRTLTQTVRGPNGKRHSATVKDQAGGAEFTASTPDGDVLYDITIQSDGAVYLTVKSSDYAVTKVRPYSGFVYMPTDA